ncbi:MAG: amino acid ABC transporter permease [Candidatus Babeliales bacterium]
MIDSSFITTILPQLIEGTITTLKIAALSTTFGFIGGTILGALHTLTNKFLHPLITLYVTLFRGTPMLIQISCIYLLLPQLGITLSAFTCAVLAISLNSAAYISQIIKSGIQSIDKGQWQAAHVLGFTKTQTMRYIILPQALRVVIPALLNESITLIKDSSLASTIGVVELFKSSSRIISVTYQPIPVYIAMACIYLLITTLLSIAASYAARKMHYAYDH